jgi:hypothetical protein
MKIIFLKNCFISQLPIETYPRNLMIMKEGKKKKKKPSIVKLAPIS